MGVPNEVPVHSAIAELAQRLSTLETNQVIPSSSGDGKDLAPAMHRMVADLKALRLQLTSAMSDIGEKLSELDSVKSENEKLKYRIKHLLAAVDEK